MEKQPLSNTISSESFISNEFGDRYLYSINRHCFDRIGSDGVYQSRWGDGLFKKDTLYIVAGSDSGVLLGYIQKRGIPEGARYVFVELTEMVPLLEPLIEEQAQEKIKICDVDNWHETARSCALAEYAYLDSVEIITSLAVEDANLADYRHMWRELDQTSQRIMWGFKIEFGNHTFALRHIENVAENRHSAYCLTNLFKNKTGVLLAGGPSLDDILPWVVQHRNDLLVVAVSRISRRLQEMNVTPDIIATVDPHPSSFDVSKHMLKFAGNSVLVNAYHASPLLLGQWSGTSLYLDHRYPWRVRDNDKIINGMGPTVSNSALNLMIAMGCNQIILAGLDLCFSQEGFSHAKGSDERKAGPLVAYAAQTVKTNQGQDAETDNSFFNAIQSIEKQATQALEKGCQLVNPSPNAATMKNVKHVPLSEIEFKPLRAPAKEIIAAALPKNDSQTRLNSYQDALKEFAHADFKIKKIKELAQKALDHNEALFDGKGETKDFKHKIHMDKIEKQLNRDFKDFTALCKLFGMGEFVKTFRPDKIKEWSDEEIEQTGRDYYQAYIAGAHNLHYVLEQGKQRILSRIEEESASPDFDALFEQWQKDQQPGRANVWRIRHAEKFSVLAESVKLRIHELDSAFDAAFSNQEHGYMKEINQFASLKGVTGKAYEQFQNQDKQGLLRLAKGLHQREEPEAVILNQLVHGYGAELQNNITDAMEHYQAVVINEEDTTSPVLENSLSRLAYLALELQQLDQASQYLEALSGLSPIYMPQYAEILRINNELQKSIDIYTHYLTIVPDDLATMMKLGRLYQKLGVMDGAQWLFQHITEKDPDNHAAQELLKQVKMSA